MAFDSMAPWELANGIFELSSAYWALSGEVIREPQNIQEAKHLPQWEKWLVAMEEEMPSERQNKAFGAMIGDNPHATVIEVGQGMVATSLICNAFQLGGWDVNDVIQGFSAQTIEFWDLCLVKKSIMHLNRPPPISCVHLAVNAVRPLMVRIVALWSGDQVLSKIMVTIDRPNTW
ncbi:hypothetical protein EI94DRAFT_1698245 [Lactarius quietus]|nr:hypothetical protein EI94DRAFT_1698245 [Lactarius quietus]